MEIEISYTLVSAFLSCTFSSWLIFPTSSSYYLCLVSDFLSFFIHPTRRCIWASAAPLLLLAHLRCLLRTHPRTCSRFQSTQAKAPQPQTIWCTFIFLYQYIRIYTRKKEAKGVREGICRGGMQELVNGIAMNIFWISQLGSFLFLFLFFSSA